MSAHTATKAPRARTVRMSCPACHQSERSVSRRFLDCTRPECCIEPGMQKASVDLHLVQVIKMCVQCLEGKFNYTEDQVRGTAGARPTHPAARACPANRAAQASFCRHLSQSEQPRAPCGSLCTHCAKGVLYAVTVGHSFHSFLFAWARRCGVKTLHAPCASGKWPRYSSKGKHGSTEAPQSPRCATKPVLPGPRWQCARGALRR